MQRADVRKQFRNEARRELLEGWRKHSCETVSGIQLVRDSSPAGFSVRVTLYGRADKRTADRAAT